LDFSRNNDHSLSKALLASIAHIPRSLISHPARGAKCRRAYCQTTGGKMPSPGQRLLRQTCKMETCKALKGKGLAARLVL